MKFFRFGIIVFFLSLPWSSACAESPVVRVALVTDTSQIKLTVRTAHQIFDLKTKALLYNGQRQWRAREVQVTANGIQIGQDEFKTAGLRIQPKKGPAIYINGKKFRGTVEIIRQPNQRLLIVNQLDIEDYIRGVLSQEVAAWWPMEALKAQAITARTYTLYQASVNQQKPYGLVSTAYSQVYGGMRSERGRTSKAVTLTKGKVLTYQNKVFPAFYHATCAGHTENASQLWKINLFPLRGRECQFCRRSAHFRWENKLSFRQIEQALAAADIQLGTLESIKILERDISGRVTYLTITSSHGKFKVDANRFRLAMGPNIIRSTNFTIETKADFSLFGSEPGSTQVYFQGYGWGHGVGLCQWGAFFMAKSGFNAQQILGYYYPETKLKNIEEIKNAKGEIATF